MQHINGTTFQTDDSENSVQTVVGDEKQQEFFPRVKIKRWANDANFSIGTLDSNGKFGIGGERITYETDERIVSFYPYAPKERDHLAGELRWVNLGAVKPETIAAEYELSNQVKSNQMTVVTGYSATPALMYFGQYPASKYVDSKKVDLPEVRASVTRGNPAYVDDGLLVIDVHRNNYSGNVIDALNISLRQILKEQHNIDTYQKANKVYYKDPDGNDVKISSPFSSNDHVITYINVNSDYLKAYDYYHDHMKEINDKYAYGLQKNYPNVTNNIVEPIIERFSKIIGYRINNSKLTDEEQKLIASTEPILTSKKWVTSADRDDFDWYYETTDAHYEFEITLKKKPKSNIVPLSVKSKNLAFYYQPKNREENHYQPANAVGSYVAYHKTQKNNEYKTGKAFQIFRPWAIDAIGYRVWCDFDEKWDGKSDLKIIIPKDFLAKAKFPITIDPTLG